MLSDYPHVNKLIQAMKLSRERAIYHNIMFPDIALIYSMVGQQPCLCILSLLTAIALTV